MGPPHVALGVACEYFEDWPKIVRIVHRRFNLATKKYVWRIDKSDWIVLLAILGTTLVAIGVAGEFVVETISGHIEHELRVSNDSTIEALKAKEEQSRLAVAQAESDAEAARLEEWRFARFFGPRDIIRDSEMIKLRHFNGVSLIVRFLTESSDELGNADTEPYREASWFAGSFSQLGDVGWKSDPAQPTSPVSWAMSGVQIYSRRPEPGKPWAPYVYPWTDPYGVKIDTPQRKAWYAGEALRVYLQDDLGLESTDHIACDDMNGNIIGLPFPSPNLPLNAVVVAVGLKNNSDLEEYARKLLDRLKFPPS